MVWEEAMSNTKAPTNGTRAILVAVIAALLGTVFATLWATNNFGTSTLTTRVDQNRQDIKEIQREMHITNTEILQRLTSIETIMRREYDVQSGNPGRPEGEGDR
jgi:peptidoglycan hydrolase CwlO-like protein